MKRVVLTLALLAAGSTAAQAQSWYHYECTDNTKFEVAFDPQTKAAFLQFDGKSMQPPRRFSLTSRRFSKDGTASALLLSPSLRCLPDHLGKAVPPLVRVASGVMG